MKRLLYVFLIVFSLPAAASYLDSTPIINTTGTINIGYLGIDSLSVKKDLQSKDQFGDDYLVIVKTGNGKVSYKFNAAYGRFRIYFAQLTDDRPPQLVLVRAEGRGTSATSYYMDILEINKNKIKRVYKKEVASYFGSGAMWNYEISFSGINNADSDAVEIDLNLEHSPVASGDIEDAELIPKINVMRILWDPKFGDYREESVSKSHY